MSDSESNKKRKVSTEKGFVPPGFDPEYEASLREELFGIPNPFKVSKQEHVYDSSSPKKIKNLAIVKVKEVVDSFERIKELEKMRSKRYKESFKEFSEIGQAFEDNFDDLCERIEDAIEPLRDFLTKNRID